MKGLNVLLAGFGTQVGSPRVANKSKQGIGNTRETNSEIKHGQNTDLTLP